jgi:hypothetical protein
MAGSSRRQAYAWAYACAEPSAASCWVPRVTLMCVDDALHDTEYGSGCQCGSKASLMCCLTTLALSPFTPEPRVRTAQAKVLISNAHCGQGSAKALHEQRRACMGTHSRGAHRATISTQPTGRRNTHRRQTTQLLLIRIRPNGQATPAAAAAPPPLHANHTIYAVTPRRARQESVYVCALAPLHQAVPHSSCLLQALLQRQPPVLSKRSIPPPHSAAQTPQPLPL